MRRNARPNLSIPRLRELLRVVHRAGYSRGPHIQLLRGLDHITINRPTLGGGDWIPFKNSLSRRGAVGNRISSLRLDEYPHMDEEVVESIERAVEVFEDEAGGSDDEDAGWWGLHLGWTGYCNCNLDIDLDRNLRALRVQWCVRSP